MPFQRFTYIHVHVFQVIHPFYLTCNFLGWSPSIPTFLYAPSPNPTRTPWLPRKKNERSLVQEQHLLALGNQTWVVSCPEVHKKMQLT